MLDFDNIAFMGAAIAQTPVDWSWSASLSALGLLEAVILETRAGRDAKSRAEMGPQVTRDSQESDFSSPYVCACERSAHPLTETIELGSIALR